MKKPLTAAVAVAAIVWLHVVALEAADSATAMRPNIVLVLADDLGINDLACYGRADHRTPNLDRLASQGMRFTCAYTAQPICSPSRAAIMTGKCPARLNLTNFLPGRADAPSQRLLQPRIEGQLPLEDVTLAELLQDAGYATGLFGKWHLGGEGFGPREQGFDVAVSPPANTKPTRAAGGKGEFAITAAAEKFIEDHRDQSFFCFVPHNNPHIPLAAAPESVAKHRDAFHPVYAAMIETLDEAVGRLTAKIESLGLADRTIFVFTSDNGGLHVLESPGTPATHNTPFRAGKGYLYEGGLREPLILRWPGTVAAGSTCDTPIVLTDLMPTLLEAAGIDPAKTVGPLDGMSIANLLSAPSPGPGEGPGEGRTLAPPAARTLYWHFPNYTNQGSRPAGAIREGDWKLIEHFEDGSVELFNLAEDIGETNNLAAAEPERANDLRRKLQSWRARVGARMPTPNPEFDAALHCRLYIDQDPSRLVAESTAAATEPHWKSWRAAMNAAIRGRKPSVTPAVGDIRLHARDARVHGKQLRYEPEEHKNVLGYWTNAADWAAWEFAVTSPGPYEVEIQQGCGQGSGGADVAVVIGDQSLKFTVQETGHFQQMILRTIGEVELTAGRHTLAVRPQTKPGAAVMDLRRVVLRPLPRSR
jgi:arylsulfatase A-like enzyme